jgi:hypothetical protein
MGWSGQGASCGGPEKSRHRPRPGGSAGSPGPRPFGGGTGAVPGGSFSRSPTPGADLRCSAAGRSTTPSQVPEFPESELYRKALSCTASIRPFLDRRDGRVVVVEGYMDLMACGRRGSVRRRDLRDRPDGDPRTDPEAVVPRASSYSTTGTLRGRWRPSARGSRCTPRASAEGPFPPRGRTRTNGRVDAGGGDDARIDAAEPLMEYIDRGVSRKYDLGSFPESSPT